MTPRLENGHPVLWLVTGATGYLGGRVLQALMARGDHVVAAVRAGSRDRLPDSTCVAPLILPPIDGDFRRGWDAAREALPQTAPEAPHVVLHLAALSSFKFEHGPSTSSLIETNVTFATRIADLASEIGAKHFITAGSFAQDADATGHYAPNSLYAASKQAFEAVLAHYVRNRGLNAACLHLHDTYGPDDPRPKIINHLLNISPDAEPIDMTEGAQELDPVHADDVAQAFIQAAQWLDTQASGPSTATRQPGDSPLVPRFVIRGGHPRPLREVASLIEQVRGVALPIRWGGRPYPPQEIMKIQRAPMPPFWRPSVDLPTGLANIAESTEVTAAQ